MTYILISPRLKPESCLPELQSKLNDIVEQTAALNARVSHISQDNVAIKEHIQVLQSEREKFDIRLRRTEIKQCEDMLVLSGLPKRDDEDLNELLCATASALSVISAIEIVDSFRMSSKKSVVTAESSTSKCRSVLVRFSSARPGREFISLMKNKKSLLSTEICSSFPKCRIYVNVYLPADFYHLLKEVRSRAKMLNYKYVWYKENIIFVRRADKEDAFKIYSVKDLDLIKP